MSRKYRVLFLCRDNSACSIIAEALLRELAGDRFDAFSAGHEPAARIHPMTLAQLRPAISGADALSPKSWLEFTGEWAPSMDLVVALHESVDAAHAPAFPGSPVRLDWSVTDPFASDASEAERVRLFEKMFWQLVRQISALIGSPQFEVPPGRANSVRDRMQAAADKLRRTGSKRVGLAVNASVGAAIVGTSAPLCDA